MYPLYPASLRPQFMINLRKFYIDTYQDQFFVNPPAWFTMYMWMELLYHTPLSVWAIGALLRGEGDQHAGSLSLQTDLFCADDPRVPIHLLIYAVQTAVTTSTCIADYLSWTMISDVQKLELGKLYVPYLALCKHVLIYMTQSQC